MSGVRARAVAAVQTPWPLLAAWLIGGAITVITPAIKWKKDRDLYYSYQGKYIEYEQNQRAYEQAQNGNYNNNNNKNGNYYSSYQCKWFQYKCRINRMYYQQANQGGGGGNNNNGMMFPRWYAALGGKFEEERRDREQQGMSADEAAAPIKFIYVVSMMMFFGILAYGAFTFSKRRSPATLMAVIGIFGLCSLMQLLMIPQGIISTDNRDLEDSVYGWYGQLPVLMLYTDYAYVMFCVVAGPLTALYFLVQHRCFGQGGEANSGCFARLAKDDVADEPSETYREMA